LLQLPKLHASLVMASLGFIMFKANLLTVIKISGSRVVTILCDGAYRYQSRLFSQRWLSAKNLDTAIPDQLKKYIVLQ